MYTVRTHVGDNAKYMYILNTIVNFTFLTFKFGNQMHYQLVGFFGRIKYLESIADCKILGRLQILYSVRTCNPPPENEAYGPRSKIAPNI